jgi:hypothetical protein
MCVFISPTLKQVKTFNLHKIINGSTHVLARVLELGTSTKERKRSNEMAQMKLLKLVAGYTLQKGYRN